MYLSGPGWQRSNDFPSHHGCHVSPQQIHGCIRIEIEGEVKMPSLEIKKKNSCLITNLYMWINFYCLTDISRFLPLGRVQ